MVHVGVAGLASDRAGKAVSLLRGLSSGDPDQAVRHVSPDRLIQHDPSMAGGVDGLRERAGQPTGELDVASQNALQPAGTVQTGAQTVTLRLTGAFDDLQAVRDTPLAAGGRVIRVGDVAAVRHGTEDPPTFLVRHGGVPVLTLGVVMRDGWNGTRLDRDLAREVRAIHGDLPLGVGFAQVSDQARNIAEAYDEFVVKFVVALAVVMAVSLLALGWRVGVVVAASVPLTLAAVFAIMLATGRQFDRITLGALILALGLLVDDAIIAIEMMVVKLQEGLDRAAAATFASHATAAPMLAGTLVTVAGSRPLASRSPVRASTPATSSGWCPRYCAGGRRPGSSAAEFELINLSV